MTRPADLPDYLAPPLDEVAVGLHFSELPGFSDAHAGLLWGQMRSEYPAQPESQPRLFVGSDLLPGDPGYRSLPSMPQLTKAPASSRTWFKSEDQAFLLQIQNDLFITNWRRRGDAQYPRFEDIYERFDVAYSKFVQGLSDVGLGPVEPKMVEVTYINWIESLPSEQFLRWAAAVQEVDSHLTAEDIAVRTAHVIWDRDGKPTGRLTVETNAAIQVRADQFVHGQQLVLTFRERVNSGTVESMEEIRARIYRGRDLIVRMFTGVTTEGAHQTWQRQR